MDREDAWEYQDRAWFAEDAVRKVREKCAEWVLRGSPVQARCAKEILETLET